MRAMILAAGRGQRMRPLTDQVPKPLLWAGRRPLIEYHLHNLYAAGYREVVINLGWLGELIRATLGDGSHYGLTIEYSEEYPIALETAGGISKALALLGSEPFLVINGDIWCDKSLCMGELGGDLAHLVLVNNPPHHPKGDFALQGERVIVSKQNLKTFSGIGFYRPELFENLSSGPVPLMSPLNTAISAGRVGGEFYQGVWMDVGTPSRLRYLDENLRCQNRPTSRILDRKSAAKNKEEK